MLPPSSSALRRPTIGDFPSFTFCLSPGCLPKSLLIQYWTLWNFKGPVHTPLPDTPSLVELVLLQNNYNFFKYQISLFFKMCTL